MKREVVDLFNRLVDDAESYGAENLYLARRDEGYIGAPKEFRFSHVYAQRLPTYKHELLLDYIDEYSRNAHDRLRRRLTAKEADWMRREAKKIYMEESSHFRVAGSKKKSARQLDAEMRKRPSMPSKKKQPADPSAIDEVRRIMKRSGFDEEEVYGGGDNQIHFASREDGDVLEGRADPGTVRFAREKAKEVEAAVPGTKARIEVVDEWVSITVTLPSGAGTRVPAPKPEPPSLAKIPQPPSGYEVGSLRQRTSLRPGDEVKYTNFTIGGSYEGKAVVTWDHGKSVEARTLSGERIRLERASDGSLRRFT